MSHVSIPVWAKTPGAMAQIFSGIISIYSMTLFPSISGVAYLFPRPAVKTFIFLFPCVFFNIIFSIIPAKTFSKPSSSLFLHPLSENSSVIYSPTGFPIASAPCSSLMSTTVIVIPKIPVSVFSIWTPEISTLSSGKLSLTSTARSVTLLSIKPPVFAAVHAYVVDNSPVFTNIIYFSLNPAIIYTSKQIKNS